MRVWTPQSLPMFHRHMFVLCSMWIRYWHFLFQQNSNNCLFKSWFHPLLTLSNWEIPLWFSSWFYPLSFSHCWLCLYLPFKECWVSFTPLFSLTCLLVWRRLGVRVHDRGSITIMIDHVAHFISACESWGQIQQWTVLLVFREVQHLQSFWIVILDMIGGMEIT